MFQVELPPLKILLLPKKVSYSLANLVILSLYFLRFYGQMAFFFRLYFLEYNETGYGHRKTLYTIACLA